MAGDFNSAAAGTTPVFQTATYGNMIAAGFSDAWSAVHSGVDGFTAAQAGNLLNPVSQLSDRIDLILTRGALAAQDAQLVGDDPSDRTPLGLWPSDHAGLVGTVRVLVNENAAVPSLSVSGAAEDEPSVLSEVLQ